MEASMETTEMEIEMNRATKREAAVDLSPFNIDSDVIFCKVAEHMENNFSGVDRIGKIESCYRANSITGRKYIFSRFAEQLMLIEPIQWFINKLFFPVWILLLLIPKQDRSRLTVERVVVVNRLNDDHYDFSWVKNVLEHGRNGIGKGHLEVEHLTVVCESPYLCDINALKERLSRLGNITIKTIKLKVIFTKFYVCDIESYMERLLAARNAGHELKVLIGEDLHKLPHKMDVDRNVLARIPSDCFEEDELAAEITELEGVYESPHTMFGSCYPSYGRTMQSLFSYNDMAADKILIATLGHGYNPSIWKTKTSHPIYEREEVHLNVINRKNFTNETAPTYNRYYTNPWIINDYTKTSSFVICQTTYCNGIIANGATAEAIRWLRMNWSEMWKKHFENLVILIPYGGQYMEDEMKEINEASNEGIIIICAAGGKGGQVVFPAALGTVISVGVSDWGPKGREIDIHVPLKSLTELFPNNMQRFSDPRSIIGELGSSTQAHKNCGIAAARIAGLLALFLSHINSILKSKFLNPICKQMADSIKRKTQYLHVCELRELLVNEGNGSHDPQLGYGDGEEIFRKLLKCETGLLLAKLSRVLLKKSGKEIKVIKPSRNPKGNKFRIIPVSDDIRKDDYHSLSGYGVSVAVIDQEFSPKDNGEEINKEKEYHGEMCFKVIENIAPNAIIKKILDDGAIVLSIKRCLEESSPISLELEESPPISVEENPSVSLEESSSVSLEESSFVSIISCSMGTESFDLQVCKAVNEAIAKGKIVVFSAGNKGQKSRNSILYPGRIGNVLVIGGQDPYNSHLSFSSVGKEIDFLAPAEYGGHKGTSYAAPAIAGHIALLLEFIKKMSEEDYRIIAWSYDSNLQKYNWQEISIWKAAHNVFAIRDLLKLFVSKPQSHSEVSGFGCIDFSVLFPAYRVRPDIDVTSFIAAQAKKQIHTRLQLFYCRRPKSVMINMYSLELLFSNMHI